MTARLTITAREVLAAIRQTAADILRQLREEELDCCCGVLATRPLERHAPDCKLRVIGEDDQ